MSIWQSWLWVQQWLQSWEKKTNHDDTDNQKKSSESEYDQENKDSYGSIIFYDKLEWEECD